MIRALRLAWRYVTYHRWTSLVLVACLILTLYLPIAVSLVLRQFHQQIMARAESTPGLVGAWGSRLDLTLDALYFRSDVKREILYGDVKKLQEQERGLAIPLHLRFTARKYPIVGTSLEYFPFRGLSLARGDSMTRLGDCVVGANLARALGIEPGERIKSDRENDLDIAGNPPLNMRVTGILARSDSPDDDAVFVDLKTAWIIQGLGHGHDEVNQETDENLILGRDGQNTVASAAVTSYLEITDGNVKSFHFHGDFATFPITAIIVVPNNPRSANLIEGSFVGNQELQFVLPSLVVNELMAMVLQIKSLFDANALLIGIATLLLLGLVILLSLKLRQREMETMFKLGCSRSTIAALQAAELAIIGVIGLAIVAGLIALTWNYADDVIRALFMRA
jgi:putative ABC transport system permease protein